MKKRTTPPPLTQKQFVQAVKEITPRWLAQLRKKHDTGFVAVATRLRQLYRQTRGRGRRWQAVVAACRQVGLVAYAERRN